MKKISCLLLCVVFLCACHKNDFTVEGKIHGCEKDTVFLEYCGLLKNLVQDSAVVAADGTFKLGGKYPQFPDLYRLRIKKDVLFLVVDSLTKTITVDGERETFSMKSNISGSDESERIMLLRRSIIENDLANHKAFAQKLILENPASLAAYFALFQYKHGQYVFDIENHQDRRFFQAVATAFNLSQGKSARSQALYNQVLGSIKRARREQSEAQMQRFIEDASNTVLDIQLQDVHGKMRTISELRGKTVLLDFSAVGMEGSQNYYFLLREIYEKYRTRGLEIYSVSGDSDATSWSAGVSALPWVCVRGELGMLESCFRLYNVLRLPALFVLDKNGYVMERIGDVNALEEQIEKHL